MARSDDGARVASVARYARMLCSSSVRFDGVAAVCVCLSHNVIVGKIVGGSDGKECVCQGVLTPRVGRGDACAAQVVVWVAIRRQGE